MKIRSVTAEFSMMLFWQANISKRQVKRSQDQWE